jgi:phosphoglycolate phosphatase
MANFKAANQQILDFIKNYDNVIWDWNGTLIDDVDMAVTCINKLLPKYNASVITTSKYREIFDFPVKKYYSHLGLDLEANSFEEIRDQYVKDYNLNIVLNSSLFPETETLLEEIKKTKNQYILSAVSQWHLDSITTHFKVQHLFNERFGVNDHYASGKIARGVELIKYANLELKKTILIGDTIHDFEVATELGIDCLLLADGHQSHTRLKQVTSNVIYGRRNYVGI